MEERAVFYKIVRLSWGSNWYFEIWARSGDVEGRIRAGNTQFRTKREALAAAKQSVAEIAEYYGATIGTSSDKTEVH